MMKKTTQTLLLVFSTLLLLVFVTVSAQGYPAQTKRTDLSNFTGVWNTITGKGEKLVITLRHERDDPGVVTGSYHLLGDMKDKPLDGVLNGTVTRTCCVSPGLQIKIGARAASRRRPKENRIKARRAPPETPMTRRAAPGAAHARLISLEPGKQSWEGRSCCCYSNKPAIRWVGN